MPERTVTIHTSDFGDVVVNEPSWCTGNNHQVGGARIDITHSSREMPIAVPTPDGPVTLMNTWLESRPYTERPPGRGVFVGVEIDGDSYPCQPGDLHAIAAALIDHAAPRLRDLARRLTAEQGDAQ
jgi:hypothetical protein